MKERRVSALEAISFAARSIVDHFRLFFFVLLAGSGILSLVVGLVGLLNKDLISTLMSSPMFRSFQECAGATCFTIAYQSGSPIIELVTSNFITLSIAVIVLAIFFIALDFGFKSIALDVYDHRATNIERLFSQVRNSFKGLIGWFLYGAIVWFGFMFFIIPGFVALLRLAFFPFFIIDKNTHAIDALKMSYHATSGHMWDIFAFFIVLKVVIYFCFLSWVGIILTWPLSTLAYAYVYRQLCKPVE